MISYDSTIVGVLSLVKRVSGSMGERYFHIMELTTQRKSNNRLINHFGFVKNHVNIDMFTFFKGGERRKLLKNLKHPSLPYPKSENEVELEIHKLEPIESRG